MLWRNTRLRREYLYRKSLEELRNEELALHHEIDLDGQSMAVPKNDIDDEYTGAALREPKILLTISRNPSFLVHLVGTESCASQLTKDEPWWSGFSDPDDSLSSYPSQKL